MGVVRQELRAVDYRTRGGRSSSRLGVPGAELTVEPGFPGRVTVKTLDGKVESLRRAGTVQMLLGTARRRFGVVPGGEVSSEELAAGVDAVKLTRFRLETTAGPEPVAVSEEEVVRGYGVQIIDTRTGGRWYTTPIGDPTYGPRRAMQAVADAFRLEEQTA